MVDSVTMTIRQIVALVLAYLLGSIPTALILSRQKKGADIRRMGDGNMGAQNVSHMFGKRFGILVGALDIGKSALAVLLAMGLGLSLGWQMVIGAIAILGHDFPIFAGFKVGQGTAAMLGVYLVLFPLQALVALVVYGLLFAITKKHTLSASIAGALILVELVFNRQPWYVLVYVLALFIFIPIKKAADSYRVRAIAAQQGLHKAEMLKQKAQVLKHKTH
jgi:glycerol-3-phosphate acyltransferase PlsY